MSYILLLNKSGHNQCIDNSAILSLKVKYIYVFSKFIISHTTDYLVLLEYY